MASQGKCLRCKVRFEFIQMERLSLKHLGCPVCRTPLKRTSEQSRLPTQRRDPVVI